MLILSGLKWGKFEQIFIDTISKQYLSNISNKITYTKVSMRKDLKNIREK